MQNQSDPLHRNRLQTEALRLAALHGVEFADSWYLHALRYYSDRAPVTVQHRVMSQSLRAVSYLLEEES